MYNKENKILQNMKFKGTIIITDPGYVVKDCTEKNPYPFPWTTDLIHSPNIAEMIKQYNGWEAEHDDWIKCEYGINMEALGIHNYIKDSTLYGNWGCTTYKTTEDPYKIINKLIEASENDENYVVEYPKLGNFCMDSGAVSVFLLDEVRKYNPDIDKWIAAHDWCVTIIPDFDGEVNYYVDKQNNAHIVGIGNINFFTV